MVIRTINSFAAAIDIAVVAIIATRMAARIIEGLSKASMVIDDGKAKDCSDKFLGPLKD